MEFDGITDFVKSGPRRLRDAEELLQKPSLLPDEDELRRRQFGICAKWRSLWRYDSRPATRREAEEFVAAARAIVDWLTPQITRR